MAPDKLLPSLCCTTTEIIRACKPFLIFTRSFEVVILASVILIIQHIFTDDNMYTLEYESKIRCSKLWTD